MIHPQPHELLMRTLGLMLSSQGSLVSGAGAEPQPSKALGMLHLGSRDVTEHPGLNHAPGLCSSSYPQPPTQP